MTDLSPVLEYLAELERHNERAWYRANKAWYQAACGAFDAFLQTLLPRIQAFDSAIPPLDTRELTFKLVRDTRFSHDKSPYRPAFRAHIGPRGKQPIPVGYYLFLQPGGRSFLGGGLFADMFQDATARIRERIAGRPEEWEAVVRSLEALAPIGGTKLKNVPRGYDPAHPQGEALKHKSWYLELPVPDRQVLAETFAQTATAGFRRMHPLNAFLNQALEGFEMPSRPG